MLCLSVDAAYCRVSIFSVRQYISQSEVGWVPVFFMCLVPEPVGHYHYFELGLHSSSFKGC
jgi:hypothetical protein